MPGQDKKIGERNLPRPFRILFWLFRHRFNLRIAFIAALLSITALLAGCLSTTVPRPADRFPKLIENGDFESYYPPAKPYIWRLEPETFFLWDLFSRPGGKRSLFIGASMIAPLDNARLTCRLRLPVEPQAAYLFEGSFIRNRNIDGVYPTVSLFGQERRLSDFWASGKWQKISVIFQSPAKLKSAQAPSEFLKIEAPRDDYFLWLDDLSLREIKTAAVGPLNGARINRESIEFTWEMTPTDRLLDVVLVLSRDKNFNGRDILEFRTNNGAGDLLNRDLVPNGNPVQPFAEDSEVLTLFLPNYLKKGKWFWRLEIYQYKTLLAMSDIRQFFIEKEYPEISSASSPASGRGDRAFRAADEEARGGPEIQNLDFFPIGMYGVLPEDFKELIEIGFNAASFFLSGPDSLLPALSAARANNLKALVSPSAVLQARPDRPGYAVSLPAGEPRDLWRTEHGNPTFLQLLHSDSILGWYLEDEPEGRSISPKILFNRRAELFRLGFRRPGVIVLNRSWRAPDYAPAADVIMTDPYPIPFEPLSWLSTSLDEIRACFAGDPSKRLWAVIQAFGWNCGAKAGAETGLGREPTGEEVQALTYLALAHRAQGLFYYVYKSGNYLIKEKGDLWEGLRKTVGEVRQLLPVIQAPEAGAAYTMKCDKNDAWGIPAVHSILKELKSEGNPYSEPRAGPVELARQPRPGPAGFPTGSLRPGAYLIAVNTLNAPVTAALDFKRPPSAAAFDFFSGAGFPLSDSRLILEFKPMERKVLYFHPAL